MFNHSFVEITVIIKFCQDVNKSQFGVKKVCKMAWIKNYMTIKLLYACISGNRIHQPLIFLSINAVQNATPGGDMNSKSIQQLSPRLLTCRRTRLMYVDPMTPIRAPSTEPMMDQFLVRSALVLSFSWLSLTPAENKANFSLSEPSAFSYAVRRRRSSCGRERARGRRVNRVNDGAFSCTLLLSINTVNMLLLIYTF